MGMTDAAPAEQCRDPHFRALRAKLVAQNTRNLQEIARTGDCSLIPAAIAFTVRANQQVNQALANTNGMCSPAAGTTSTASLESQLRQMCKEAQKRNAAQAANSSNKAGQNADTGHAPASKTGTPQSSSCSDITGTGGSTPRATNCQNGNKMLEAARAMRAQNPAGSAASYKKAADAYRQAGDNAQAEKALQEAVTLVANAAPPQPIGGASQPVQNPASGASRPLPRHWQGTSDPDDCDQANELERGTAAWYDSCVPVDPLRAALEARFKSRRYTPPISPQELTARAITTCKDVSWDEKRRCIDEYKMSTLLADDAAVRTACASLTDRDEQVACVDAVYVNGPGAYWKSSELSEILKKRLGVTDVEPANAEPTPEQKAAQVPRMGRDGCQPGYGMKPTPGAFGARSCQPLGVFSIPRKDPATNPDSTGGAVSSDTVRGFERRSQELAAMAAVPGSEPQTSESPEERQACQTVAFASAYSLLKGGAPEVPPACHETASAARGRLVNYANAHVYSGNRGTEELLAYLAARNPSGSVTAGGDLGPPLPGMTGLEPDPENRRIADCVIRGGTIASCADAIAKQSTIEKIKAADCAQAETHWKSAEEIRSIAVYEDHLARFPNCAFATLAKARIEALKNQ